MSRLSFLRDTDQISNLLAITLLFVISIVLFLSPQKHSMEALNFDVLTVLTADDGPDEQLLIIGIDEQSFANLDAQWPWPRGVHAHLLNQIKKQSPKTIVLDILFSEPSQPEEDALLAEAIKGKTPIVMASERSVQETTYAQVMTDVLPISSFLDAGALPGDVGIQNDSDQVVRLLPMHKATMWKQTLNTILLSEDTTIKVEDNVTERYIKYVGPRGTIPTISYYQALFADELLPTDFFKDKVVLIGFTMLTSPTAKTKGDNHATPFTLISGEYTPGVEIHANAINTHLQSNVIKRVHLSHEATVSFIVFGIAFIMFWKYSLGAGAALLVILSGGLSVSSYLAFQNLNIFAPVTLQITIIFCGFFIFTLLRYLKEHKQAREMRLAFEHYVPSDVVGQLVQDPSQIKLGGDRKRITVMFTDLAGFTNLAEKTGAEELSSILNDHLNRMTKIILKNGGTLDKFIGDAIMAFWGAPIAEPLQGEKAINCAIEMQEEMQKFRSEYQGLGKPPLYMRIGLNTCEAIVGNMGGEDRFDYTAIGDGVNLAARLEGANKAYGTEILVSQHTLEESGNDEDFCLLDKVRVKGKTQPIKIYTISPNQKALLMCDEFMERYSDGSWNEAIQVLNQIAELTPLKEYAANMKIRIQKLQLDSGGNWDGITDLAKL